MKSDKIISAIGIIEILIGAITLLAVLFSILTQTNPKPFNVMMFVIITAYVSLFLGVGVLEHYKTAYQLLIYFSSVIILSKVLIATNIISLTGALETSIAQSLKDKISILYHFYVIFFLRRKDIKAHFYKI